MLKEMTLGEMKDLMRRCGLSTANIDSTGRAVKAMIEKGVIEV